MQLLFQPIAAVVPQSTFKVPPRFVEFLHREEIQDLAGPLIGLLIVSQIISVAANWIASKAVIERGDATLKNAIFMWLSYLGYSLVIVIALGIILPIAATQKDAWRALLILGGTGLLFLLLIFLIPMKIYAVGFLRAVGLVLLALLIGAVANLGVQFAAGKIFGWEKRAAALAAVGGKTAAERQHFFARVNGYNSPDEIDRLLDEALYPIGPRPPLAERERAVAVLQQKLRIRRAGLSSASSATAAAFPRQYQRYLQLLNEVGKARQVPPQNGSH